jgi:hypothetical protein
MRMHHSPIPMSCKTQADCSSSGQSIRWTHDCIFVFLSSEMQFKLLRVVQISVSAASHVRGMELAHITS